MEQRGKPFEKGNQVAKKKETDNYVPMFFASLPRHTIPEFREKSGQDWITYGIDNIYPEYLLKLSQRSAKHNAILTGKQHFIVGNGWTQEDESEDVKLQVFIDHPNKKETLDDILTKIAFDLELYGGFALEIIWNKLATKIATVAHIDFKNLRSSKENSLFYFTEDWAEYDLDDLQPVLNPQYNKDWNNKLLPFNPKNKHGKQILYFKQYRSGQKEYPIPEYIGCVPYVELDYEISNFHLSAIKNNFVGGYWINFRNGIPLKEKQREIERALRNKFVGSDRAGTFVVNFSDFGKEPEFKPLQQNDMDKMFDILNKTVRQEIFTGHKVTSPNLFGVETDQPFGNRIEIREKTEIFQNFYVTPRQNIIERIFNRLASINGLPPKLKIQPIETLTEQLSEQTLIQVLTTDELREKAGKEPKEVQPQEETMSEEERKNILKMFQERGEQKSTFATHEKRPFFYKEDPNEKGFIASVKFANNLDRSILDLLDKDPLMPILLISKTLNISQNDVKTAIGRLRNSERISSKTKASGDDKVKELKPTTKGLEVIKEDPARTADIEVRYSYEVEAGLGARTIDTTRPFCRNLITMDKFYTRAEIEQISASVGRNVWETRGGWYHNPNTKETTPFCRHIWFQNIVTKKQIT